MYESPIKIIEDINRDVTDAFDDYVCECIFRYGVEVDKEELVRALNYDRHMYENGYEDGFADGKRFAQNESSHNCGSYNGGGNENNNDA